MASLPLRPGCRAGGRLAALFGLACAVGGVLGGGSACNVAGTVQPTALGDDGLSGDGPLGGDDSNDELPLEGAPTQGTGNTPGSGNTVVVGSGTPSSPNAAGSPNAPGAVAAKGPGVAMYWGTGNDQGQDPDLATVCGDGDVRIVIVSFFDTIASYSQNQNGAPHMSINDCPLPYDAKNPRLGKCAALGQKIARCQDQGVQVIASIGGGGARVGFLSDAEATNYAKIIWDMFLGGNGTIRPFGDATLDGIDLDVEGGTPVGWAAFVLALRRLMDADTRKKYLITAAPQCPFRDAWMGPDGQSFDNKPLKGTALTLALTSFDHLFVQFYNNYCNFNAPSSFAETWQQWTSLGPVQPKIWVGLPAAKNAAEAAGFVTGPNLTKVVAAVQSSPLFGGFMFWDAGYDADTIAARNKPMRAYAAEALTAVPLR